MNRPKILFLADEIPQSKNAGSILFYRMLLDYPADRVLVVGRSPAVGAAKLPCRYIKLSFPLADRVRLSRLNRWLADFEALGLIHYRIPKEIEHEIDQFQPDVVITLMQLYMYYQPACSYAIKRKKPLVIFCHDDVEEFSRVHPSLKQMLVRRNSAFYKAAKKRLCISPQMEKAWHTKYGAHGDVVYPLPSKELIARPGEENLSLKKKGQLTLGYAGTPSYGYGFQLEEMIPVFNKIGATLRFYGATLPANLEGHRCIEYAGFDTSENTWKKVMEQCDAVVLPYTWKKGTYQKLYETHFPSKLPEYLSLGMPVVVIGPEYATGVAWALKNKEGALVIATQEKAIWEEQLLRLKNDDALRYELGKEALKKKDAFFSNQLIRDTFLAHLSHLK